MIPRVIAIIGLAAACWSSAAHAVLIGFFPGLDELIRKADAIVVLRVDRSLGDFESPTLYSTHDCYIYQTLKGDIATGKRIRLRLMDTSTAFVSPYANFSTHLMFLTRKRSEDEPTEYRTLEVRGANIRLSPFGHEKLPEGADAKEQITSLLRTPFEYNEQQHDKEQAFLEQVMNGSAGEQHGRDQDQADESQRP